jgi:hypothetical protein
MTALCHASIRLRSGRRDPQICVCGRYCLHGQATGLSTAAAKNAASGRDDNFVVNEFEKNHLSLIGRLLQARHWITPTSQAETRALRLKQRRRTQGSRLTEDPLPTTPTSSFENLESGCKLPLTRRRRYPSSARCHEWSLQQPRPCSRSCPAS